MAYAISFGDKFNDLQWRWTHVRCLFRNFSDFVEFRSSHANQNGDKHIGYVSNICNSKSSPGDEIPERDVMYLLLCLLIYHWTTTHLYFQNIFLSRPNDNCNISNRRRFTKSALRILLLSNFRVSSINYSLASSLPIHTRSSANAEGPRAHCHFKSCKMLHKCSTDCIWKSLQPVNDLQGHSRSLPLLPFYRPYTFLSVFHCKYISILHRFRYINTYLPKH